MVRLQIKMIRVPAPEWAPSHARGEVKFQMVADQYRDAITPAERESLLERHEEILGRVDALVLKYAKDQSAPPGEDWFPEQKKFSGKYYIGGESYHRLSGESWIQLRIEVRCVGLGANGPGDYLGLHLWFRYDPKSGRLRNHRNIDSMVI